jgi:hypothetical protein
LYSTSSTNHRRSGEHSKEKDLNWIS